jgi:hypothetical protein
VVGNLDFYRREKPTQNGSLNGSFIAEIANRQQTVQAHSNNTIPLLCRQKRLIARQSGLTLAGGKAKMPTVDPGAPGMRTRTGLSD